MSFESLLNATATIQRATKTKDSLSGVVETWADNATGVPCRVVQLSGREQQLRGAEGVISSHRVFFKLAVDVTEKDRVVVADLTYDVNFVSPTSKPHHLEVLVKRRA